VTTPRPSVPTRPAGGVAPLIAVVGAGITGLVAARRLAAAGARVVVLEERDGTGGQLRGATVAGRHVDVGAESVFTAAPGPLELIAELGLTDRLVPASRGTTWIWTERGLRPLPEGFTPAGPSRLGPVLRSGVLSVRGMLRAGLEPLVPATRGADGRAGRDGDDRDGRDGGDHHGDLAVGTYLERRFGREVTDRLVDPLLGGLHAGDVRRLSLRAATPQLAALADRHRSLLLRRRPAPRPGPTFVTLAGGLATITDRLAADLDGVPIRTRIRVTRVERAGAGRPRLSFADGSRCDVDGVVLATPAHVAAELLTVGSPAAAAGLSQLRAASVVVAALAYPAAIADLPAIAQGTGVLVPSTRPTLLKAATLLSTKWPHHADEEVFLVRASAGRAGDDRAIGLDDGSLLDRLHDELAQATGLRHAPLDVTVQRWPSAMPQLEVGHHQRLAAVGAALARDLPGVVLAGAPYHGPGLSACLRSAALAVDGLLGALDGTCPAGSAPSTTGAARPVAPSTSAPT
jgi:protoporphyrinogen/coproporphyrinogen III oxidase